MNKTKNLLILTVILSMVLSVAVLALNGLSAPINAIEDPHAWAVSDRGIIPSLTSGNNDATTYPSDFYFKEDFPVSGLMVYDLGMGRSLSITIGNDTHGESITSWVAVGINIKYFVVKAGTDFFTYNYAMLSHMDDGSLYPPLNPAGQNPAISHFSVYYDAETEETTETSIDLTTESIPLQSETTMVETTEPSGETVTETTIELTTESIPLQSETTMVATTQPSGETVVETTTIMMTDPDIPQTGETGSGNGLLIGLVLLIMAGGLTAVIYRSQKVKA